jgi:hypothetical protein
MQLAQLWQSTRSDPQQKSPQRGGIGIGSQPSQELKHAILLQELRRLDPLQTEHHRIQQGQEHFPNGVAMVPLVKADFLRDSVLEPDAREEAVQQVHSTVVREACSTELYAEFARSFGHCAQSYPWGRVRRNHWMTAYGAFLQARTVGSRDLHAGFRLNIKEVL